MRNGVRILLFAIFFNLVDCECQVSKVRHFYNYNTKEFTKNDQIIPLSSTEQKLLEIFIERLGTSISRLELSKIMGGLSERSIDVQITRIRNKLEDNPKEPKYLKTVRNEGYALYI